MGFDEIMKGGWHPGQKGGAPSSSNSTGGSKSITGLNLRGKVPEKFSGYLGSKGSQAEDPRNHVSTPLQSLKDPSTFGPPPKHINHPGGAASPSRTTAPERRGLGAPLSTEEIEEAEHATRGRVTHQQEEEVEEPKYERGPFRVDTTGLSTANLPPPPVRRDGADSRSPAPPPTPVRSQGAKPKPSLPPRLPQRQNSNPGSGAPSPPPTYGAAVAEPPAHKGILNEGSLKRLGSAGISVPGFGIGAQKPPLSARTSTSSTSQSTAISPPPPQAPARTGVANGPQLEELQSRFSRFGTSSPASETPSQGTSFAQKQAALRTASSFRNDPTSVSLSDARNAASTANNFKQRHGDQISAGWKSAQNLNNKYGVADKVGRYNTTTHTDDDDAGGPIMMQDNTVVAKKKPPPPPKKKPGLGMTADTGEGPPPLPLASKPKLNADARSSHPERKNLDLDLGSLWFAQTPAAFPPQSIARLAGSRGYASSSGWSSDGVRKTYTFTGVIRHCSDLSTTKIHLTWDGANPGLTVRAEQKHLPPPRPLSTSELEDYREQYSDRVANWCESRLGQQVGNGECWTLADEALKAIAAEERSRGVEPCMTSQSVVHGSVIFTCLPPKPCEPRGGVEAAGVARGDIIQFLSAHLKRKDGHGESWAGAPDHTAIVTHVERSGLLRVVESNSGGVKRVKEGQYDFSELVGGEVRIFRVVGESWVGPLDASWP